MGYFINDRWLRIPEDDIYRLYVGRGDVWGQKEIYVGDRARYYLSSSPYAYPYSLPPDVIERLVTRLNEGRLMLDHAHWYEVMKGTPGYNDTEEQVTVEARPDATWIILGVHRLTEEERPERPTIFFDVRCTTGNRDGMRPVYWEWDFMMPHEKPGPAFVDKPPFEVGIIAVLSGVVMSMWMDNGDRVTSFQGDDSYFVVFQEVDTSAPPDLPDPDPLPLEVKGTIRIKVDKDYFNSLPTDDQNRVDLVVPIYTRSLQADD